MRFHKLLLLFVAACSCVNAPSKEKECEVIWTEGAGGPSAKTAVHKIEILGAPAGTDWTIWFCQFRTPIKMKADSPASIEYLGGSLYRIVPEKGVKGGTMKIRYEANTLVNHSRAPEGFCLQKKGKKAIPAKVTYVWQPSEKFKTFEWNQTGTAPFDMIPRVKSAVRQAGTTPADAPALIENPAKNVPAGWYRITVDGGIRIQSGDEDGAFYAEVTLANLRRNAKDGIIPNGVIEDWPDFPYRGMMLDVSRNFTRKEDVLKLLDIFAHYKINYFHLHFTDDEGWRVAIDALPELTSYGAFRGIPTLQKDGSIRETDALMPSYCITTDRDAASSGNGFYSRADFIEILQYAWKRRIRVIPEFDMPGHSRAAIKAMEVRAARTGDASCLLSEPGDTSKYVSAQDYSDNAVNVALPTTYNFIEKIFDALISMYAEAGVPLEAIHVGGDEVPKGAWEGAPACRKLMQETGHTDINWLKDWFISHVLDIAEAKGVRIAGWQEAAQHLEPETLDRLKKNLAFTNFWAVSRGRDVLCYQYANEGIPVVLSNSSNFYFDLAYNPDKNERGLSWAGFCDERRSFSFLPYQMYRSVRWDNNGRMRDISLDGEGKPALTEEGRGFIKGVSGQLWSETIRNFDHVTYYLFPKAAGLAERGWNASPSWEGTLRADDPAFTTDFDRFFSIITDVEYPYYDSLGISYHTMK